MMTRPAYWSMFRTLPLQAVFLVSTALPGTLAAQTAAAPKLANQPWMDKSLSADARADLLVKEMTLDEKIGMVNGGGRGPGSPAPVRSVGGAGFVTGVERLGIPDLQMADSAVGVARSARFGRYSTAMPSTLAESATWNTELASSYGEVIGRELRAQGYNMSLAGGVNITREPRNGRNFEYQGEDPILAGTMVGSLMAGMHRTHVITDIKHYALNDQETGRYTGNIQLDERSLRESDLLAFEIGLHISKADAVMCSYNKLNGDWACENKYLLTDLLKNTWGFKGWVISDWNATHTTVKAAEAGLDQEQPTSIYFGEKLKEAVLAGTVPQARLDDMVHRILRSFLTSGAFDDPPQPMVPDVFGDAEIARKVAEQSIVLLKNRGDALPLTTSKATHVLLVGSHADVGVLSGGGSAQVDAPGGNAVQPPVNAATMSVAGSFTARGDVWLPSSPLKSLKERMPQAHVDYDPGTDLAAAASKAAKADVVIVFANQPTSEGKDAELQLPGNQDALVDAVASANKNTIVVLETGAQVTMPWLDKVASVVEAWYPGVMGGQAIADILSGAVVPTGKLSITFPRSVKDLPEPEIFGSKLVPTTPAGGGRPQVPFFDVPYVEGLLVGYKWYDARSKDPLFPFGYGLSYTTYRYAGIKAVAGNGIQLRFTVKNTGKRAGTEVSEVYLGMPQAANEPPKRLVGWSRTELGAGEEKIVNVTVDPHYCAVFDATTHGWQIVPGDYVVMVGGSSKDLPLKQTIHLEAASLTPLMAD